MRKLTDFFCSGVQTSYLAQGKKKRSQEELSFFLSERTTQVGELIAKISSSQEIRDEIATPRVSEGPVQVDPQTALREHG